MTTKRNAGLWLVSLCAWLGGTAVLSAPEHVLTPLRLPGNTLVQAADPTHFTFIVGGDNRPPAHGDPMPPSLAQICTEIGWIHPDFVLWTGDIIEGYGDSAGDASSEYDAFLAPATKCDVPIFMAPGNHELGFNDPSMESIYEQKIGPLYGAFDYGNSHFIALDTSPVVNGAVQFGAIDPAQLAWLQTDLATERGKASNIFVFFHHYLFGPPDPDTTTGNDTGFADTHQRDMLHRLFVKYGVRAVFCGHDHIYWHHAKDGIDYYIAGNAGAPMDASPDQGGFLGYVLFTVDGTKATPQLLTPWNLVVRNVTGNDGLSATSVIAIDQSNHADIALRGITASVPLRQSYSASGAVDYKGKAKAVDTKIISATPSADGKTQILTLSVAAPQARTTLVTIAPAPSTN